MFGGVKRARTRCRYFWHGWQSLGRTCWGDRRVEQWSGAEWSGAARKHLLGIRIDFFLAKDWNSFFLVPPLPSHEGNAPSVSPVQSPNVVEQTGQFWRRTPGPSLVGLFVRKNDGQSVFGSLALDATCGSVVQINFGQMHVRQLQCHQHDFVSKLCRVRVNALGQCCVKGGGGPAVITAFAVHKPDVGRTRSHLCLVLCCVKYLVFTGVFGFHRCVWFDYVLAGVFWMFVCRKQLERSGSVPTFFHLTARIQD